MKIISVAAVTADGKTTVVNKLKKRLFGNVFKMRTNSLYSRLSHKDKLQDDSNSISNHDVIYKGAFGGD